MRITFLTNTLSGGGAEKQLLIIAAGLAERGHRCRIYCLSPVVEHGRYRPLLERGRTAGVAIIAPRSRWGASVILLRLAGTHLFGPREILWTWGFRAEFLRTFCPAFWRPRCVVALRTASDYHVRTHAWMLRLSRIFTWRYVANSERGLDVFAAVIPAVRSRGRVVYNALEGSLFSRPPAPLARSNGVFQIHMLGNLLWAVKGYDVALDVAAQIRAQNLPVHIRIAGDLPAGEKDPTAEIARRGLSGTISWAGRTDAPCEFLAQGDAFLLLSRYEGTPNALLEAMAQGIPSIATDVGDLRRFAADGAGLTIIPVADAGAATAAIEKLYRDPVGARSLGEQSRTFCRRRFSEHCMLDDVEAALKP